MRIPEIRYIFHSLPLVFPSSLLAVLFYLRDTSARPGEKIADYAIWLTAIRQQGHFSSEFSSSFLPRTKLRGRLASGGRRAISRIMVAWLLNVLMVAVVRETYFHRKIRVSGWNDKNSNAEVVIILQSPNERIEKYEDQFPIRNILSVIIFF